MIAILDQMCIKMYLQTRKFLWSPNTRFLKILLLLKFFKQMTGGLYAIVAKDAYTLLNLDSYIIDDRFGRDKS